MDPGLRHGSEAVALLGIASRIMQMVARWSRDVQEDDRSSRSTWSSLMTPVATMTTEQQARVMTMIADPPKVVEHRCPKCGTLIHADVVHGGFGPCRKCGWSPSAASPSSS
jgi:hypothetical protein